MVEDFFNWLDLDQASYWIGFLCGALFFWVLRRARPIFGLAGTIAFERFNQLRDSLTTSTEIRLRADVLKLAQTRHLAHPLCALDEIVIAPKIVLPPPLSEQKTETTEFETVEHLLPFHPELPAVYAAFAYPGQKIEEIFLRDADILLMSGAGTGKTVALAYLASQLARKAPELGHLSDSLPIYIDAVDLIKLHNDEITAFDLCYAVVSRYASTMTQTRLAQVLKNALNSGNAFLIVDSVDELPPGQVQTVSDWLQSIRSRYPKNRVIVAASPVNHDALLPLNLQPASIIGLDRNEKQLLFTKWQTVWQEIIHNQPLNPFNTVSSLILDNWLSNSPYPEPPLTYTLRLWALCAGDLLGPNELTSLEAYFRRGVQDHPEARKFLSNFAYHLLVNKESALKRSELSLMAAESIPIQTVEQEQLTEQSDEQTGTTAAVSPTSRLINALIDAGILREVAGDAITFSNLIFSAYLVCEQFIDPATVSSLLDQPRWESRQQCLWLLAATQDLSTPLSQYIESDNSPLSNRLVEAGRWLQFAHRSNEWTANALRMLASQLQNTAQPITLRFRILGALAACENKSIDVLFRRMLTHFDAETRMFGCFGCGIQQDIKALPDIKNLLADPDTHVRQAACLALGAIGGTQAVEAMAMGLLQDDEALQKCAAEMLATDRDEGHATLQEGTEFDDLLVRRAVVYGLKKVNSNWSTDLLAKIQLEDPQWVVRNAAEQALEQLEALAPSIPMGHPELMNTPWIIEFASEQGLGVASNEAAADMLVQAVQGGNESQQAKALQRIPFLPQISEGMVAAVYTVVFGSTQINREKAYFTLWLLSGRHVVLPEPIQFDLS